MYTYILVILALLKLSIDINHYLVGTQKFKLHNGKMFLKKSTSCFSKQ